MKTNALIRFCPTFSTPAHLEKDSDYNSPGSKKHRGLAP
jgi:hypothetical protein